ncbi:MAG: hypothetical protein HRT81_16090 [Henriciella sp.]|nr:hypothetical protein [Henriciella sp.]
MIDTVRAKQIAARLIHRSKEMGVYVRAPFQRPRKDQVRLAIFAQGRTGSTLLENLIVSTGLFSGYGEILSADYSELVMPFNYLNGLANATDNNFICHIKIHHLTSDRMRPLDYMQFLKRMKAQGWQFIFLERENLVEHVLSSHVAYHRNAYHNFTDKAEQFKIDFDPNFFAGVVADRRGYRQIEEEVMKVIDPIRVSYERDLLDNACHQTTTDRILSDLGLPARSCETEHRKVIKQNPVELFNNPDLFLKTVEELGLSKHL